MTISAIIKIKHHMGTIMNGFIKIGSVLILLMLVCGYSLAETSFGDATVCKKKIALNTSNNLTYINPSVFNMDPNAARSGCCSHHEGVCGCQSNRAFCCDGTLSPSCGCD